MTVEPVMAIGKRNRRIPRPFHALIPHYTLIIETLLNYGSLGTNEIFRKLEALERTGLNNKRNTIDALSYLRKCFVVNKVQDPYHSQRVKFELSDIGRDLALFVQDIKEYCQSFEILHAAYNSRVSDINRKKLTTRDKDLLKYFAKHDFRGSEEAALEFIYWMKDPSWAISLLENLSRHVIIIIIYKYNLLLKNKPNPVTRELIKSIIIDLLDPVMNLMSSVITSDHEEETNKLSEDIAQLTISNVFSKFQSGVYGDHAMEKEIDGFLLSILKMLRLRKDTLEHFIAAVNKDACEDEKDDRGFERPDYSPDPYWGKTMSRFSEYVLKNLS